MTFVDFSFSGVFALAKRNGIRSLKAFMRWILSDRISSIGIAVLFCSSAAFKWKRLVDAPLSIDFLMQSRVAETGLVIFELFVASLLFAKPISTPVRIVAIWVFMLFLVFSIRNLFVGKTTCGCFGSLIIHPAMSALISVLAIAWLTNAFRFPALNKTKVSAVGPYFFNHKWQCVFYLFIVWPTSVGWLIYTTAESRNREISELGYEVSNGEGVYLIPGNWKGRRLPIEKYLDGGAELVEGNWKLIFYSNQCPKCRNLVEQILVDRSINQNVGLICPTPEEKFIPISMSSGLRWFWLSKHHKWYIELPQIIELHNGMVQ